MATRYKIILSRDLTVTAGATISGVNTGDLTYSNGWIPSSGWSYASASTITVPSGAASIYQVGDKIKLTQTTVKYFYIIAVADTVLTVSAGTDYTVANEAITLPFYSHIENPLGFPTVFACSSGFMEMHGKTLIQRGNLAFTCLSGQSSLAQTVTFAHTYPNTNYTITLGGPNSDAFASRAETAVAYYLTKQNGSFVHRLHTTGSATWGADRSGITHWRVEGIL